MKRDVKITSRGFTLIASLLLLLLLSGLSIALLLMVNTEQRSGGYDLNNTYTYHAAEGAIEKMTSDLASTFKNIQAPSAGQICALSSNYPTWDTSITYVAYNVSPVTNSSSPCTAPLTPVWGPIQSGPNAGLYAQIIPVTMNVTAQRATGEAVSMTRTAEVALIPVFQFGVFSDSDLFFGRSPNLGFAGRVHTNGDLYLGVADGYNLVFGDKISAFENVIRQQMDNGVTTAGNDNSGTVMIPTQANGCSSQMANVAAASPSATCVDISTTALGSTDGSVTGGHASGQFGSWKSVSTGTYQGYIIDGNGNLTTGQAGPNSTGATDLTLPFVSGTTNAVQIIRVPPAGEAVSSVLGQNREANLAQIRILLADNEAQLHLSDWNGNAAQDYQLVSLLPSALSALPQGGAGGTVANGIVIPGAPVAGANPYYFAESYCTGTAAMTTYLASGYPATRICPTSKNGDSNQVIPLYYGPLSNGPGGAALVPTAFPAESAFTTANTGVAGANGVEWPLIGGWLLVEAKWASDEKWHGVTQEWLQLGFARGLQVPTLPGTPYKAPASNAQGVYGSNYLQDHANAILYFQETADRGGNNTVTGTGAGTDLPLTANFYGAGSQYNWYPINLYDAREGENYDAASTFAASSGTPNGVINTVELDVGNLKNWLAGTTGATGTNVDFSTQNGYVLYFSDRRGMQFATSAQGPNYQQYWGEYGFEDSVNYQNSGAHFAPDGALDPLNYNGISAEDLNGNAQLDNYGVKYVGDAFGPTTATDTDTAAILSPYAIGHRINTFTIGRANRVTGARHALKLVDGSMGNLPTMPPGNVVNNCAYVNSTTGAAQPTGCGGFTVASENPVYIQGNYNSNCPAAGVTCTPSNGGAYTTNYDPTWGGGAEPNHAAAAIIADAVTLLSNEWQDWGCTPSGGACSSGVNKNSGSMLNPTNPNGTQSVPAQTPNRIAITTYYRVAIAAGKNIAFYNTVQNPEFAYGMDGGVHNFLRFLEDWGGPSTAGSQQQLYYKGSIVSLYWSYYATGPFKCCNTVYNPPDRQYTFDGLFSQPQNLPPGTPMFRNVDNLTYRQNQVALTSAP
jgi:Tfp pilus assembly protein PilX